MNVAIVYLVILMTVKQLQYNYSSGKVDQQTEAEFHSTDSIATWLLLNASCPIC